MGIQTETPMETLVGIQCDDCVLLMCDRSATRSIIRFNDEQDKIFTLDSHMAMASVQKKGGDSAQFSEYVQKNLKLYQLKTGTKLSTRAASNFIRGELARCLRQKPYYVDLLIGGHDSEGPPVLPRLHGEHAENVICMPRLCRPLCNSYYRSLLHPWTDTSRGNGTIAQVCDGD